MHLPRPTIDLRKEQVRHQTSNDDLSSQLTEKQEELKELLEELQFGRENMDNLQTHALAQASLARQEVRDFKNGTSTNGTREREERARERRREIKKDLCESFVTLSPPPKLLIALRAVLLVYIC